jgi:hypothetical protein
VDKKADVNTSADSNNSLVTHNASDNMMNYIKPQITILEPTFLVLKKQSRLMRSRCCLCVCVSVYPLIVAREQLGKNPHIVARQKLSTNVTMVTNTHATIEEWLDASFSMWPVSYQGKWAISSSQNLLF